MEPAPPTDLPPKDLNDVFARPAARPAAAPPLVGAGMTRARAVSTPPPWNGPESPDAFAKSIYESERQAARSRNVMVGLLLLVVGIIVTAVTYDSASQQGGTYIIAWGPMVFGALRLFKGLAG